MANTYTDYTSGAGETNFAINFDYLEDYHVIVNIDGTDYDVNSSGGSFTFTISTSPTKEVVISPPLSAGQKVRVYRNTRGINNDQVGRLVNFSDGSVIKANDLDTTYLHNLYLAQEASEDPISTVNAEDGAILTWSEDNGRWEVSGAGAVANAVLAYNSSTKKWDVIPLNLQYDSGNATFGFGGTPSTTYKHKFYGDLLIRDDDNAVNGAVLTIENTSTTGNGNAVLILASYNPILQFYDTNGTTDNKYFNVRLVNGELKFIPLDDGGAEKNVALKLTTDGYNVYGNGGIEDAAYKHTFHGDVLMHDTDAGSECVLKIQTEGTDPNDLAAIILEGTSSVVIFQDTDAPTDKGRAHIGIDNDYLNFAVYNDAGTTLYGVPLKIGTGSNPAAANNNSGEIHNILMENLPTSDPGVTHAIWNRNGTVAMSGSSKFLYDSGWSSNFFGTANPIAANSLNALSLSAAVEAEFPWSTVTFWGRAGGAGGNIYKIGGPIDVAQTSGGTNYAAGIFWYYSPAINAISYETKDYAIFTGSTLNNVAWGGSDITELRVTIE